MLLMECASTKIDGTGYTIEYAITQKGEEEDPESQAEYGISCTLYELEREINAENVMGITSEWSLITKVFQILRKNQVFPVHVREIIEDLLVLEYEEKKVQILI